MDGPIGLPSGASTRNLKLPGCTGPGAYRYPLQYLEKGPTTPKIMGKTAVLGKWGVQGNLFCLLQGSDVHRRFDSDCS